MTNRLELNWKLDGLVDEQRYYCSATPIDPEDLPAPKAVLAGDVRSYIDYVGESGKEYCIRIGALKDTIEKVSDEKKVLFGKPWTPDGLSPQIYLSSDDLTATNISSWTDRKTGVAFTKQGSGTINVVENDNTKMIKFQNNAFLTTSNSLVTALMKAKSQGSIFTVFAKGSSTTNTEKYIFCFRDSGGSAGFATATNFGFGSAINKLLVGARRANGGSFGYLGSAEALVDSSVHIGYTAVNHDTANFNMTFDGGAVLSAGTGIGTGVTENTNSAFVNIGGGAASDWFDGYIACILFFDRTLSDTDRQKLEGWAAHKYGLTRNLPADHPYKNLVPTL